MPLTMPASIFHWCTHSGFPAALLLEAGEACERLNEAAA
jgi:hypothetical protein